MKHILSAIGAFAILMSSAHALEILDARYRGTVSGADANITDIIKNLCRKSEKSCEIFCNNQALRTDPAIGQRKTCNIVFHCEGGSTKTAVGDEDTRVLLSCVD